MVRFNTWIRRAVCLVCMAISVDAAEAADGFRVETDIFLGNKTDAAIQYLTIFTGDIVYDFRLTAPEEITLFDTNRNRIVLLDLTRKVKTTWSTDELLQNVAAMKAYAEPSNPTVYAAVNPQFEATADDGSWLTLTNKHLTYRIKGLKPKFPAATHQYQEFADWSARLNAMRPGNLPPFARIAVNKEVAERGWLPEEVERTIVGPAKIGKKTSELRTHHLVNWSLSETDSKRIKNAGDNLVSFQAIPFDEYRKPAEVATADKPSKK